ncbi:MAG: hypothetical protein KA803_12230 [Rhodoferax sp.]|nr:hypothetical protein [Rhodoferax sp.]
MRKALRSRLAVTGEVYFCRRLLNAPLYGGASAQLVAPAFQMRQAVQGHP